MTAALMAVSLGLAGVGVAHGAETGDIDYYYGFVDPRNKVNAAGDYLSGGPDGEGIPRFRGKSLRPLVVQPEASYFDPDNNADLEVAYCFNMGKNWPKLLKDGAGKYELRKNDDLAKYLGNSSKSSGELVTGRYANGSQDDIESVVLNGYPRNAGNLQQNLSDDEFRVATQLAIWHFTDGFEIDKFWDGQLSQEFFDDEGKQARKEQIKRITDAYNALIQGEGAAVPEDVDLDIYVREGFESGKAATEQNLLGVSFSNEDGTTWEPDESQTPTITETTTTTVTKDCDCTPKTVTTTVPTVTSTAYTTTETATVTPTTFTSTPTVTTIAEAQTETKTPDVVTTTLVAETATETPDVVTTTEAPATVTESAPNVTETVTQTETVTETSTENAPTVTTTVAGETVTVTADATTTTVTPAPVTVTAEGKTTTVTPEPVTQTAIPSTTTVTPNPVTEVAATETVTPAPVTETAAPSTVTVPANPVTETEAPKPETAEDVTVEEKANGALVVIVRDRSEKVVERIEVPTGWNVEEGKVKEITPTRDEKGNIILHITFVDGKTTTINASEQKQVTKTGSSDNEVLQRCWANAKNSPIFWLLPVGILVAVGAPVVNQVGGPVKEQMDRLNAEIAKQFQWNNQNNNNRRPAGHGGQGIERDNNRRNAGAGDIAAQVDELNRRLGQAFGSPEAQQAGGILAVVAALGATAGLMYYWCSNEPTEDGTPLLSSKLNAKKD